MEFIWLIIVIALAIIEMTTVSLVTIWFIASGIVSLILSFFIDSVLIQVAVFVILGIILLLTTRKYLVNLISKKSIKTNTDRIIGMTGIVTEKITKSKPGEVKVDGKYWTAVADKTIDVEKNVKILKIEGVKLYVWEDE